MKCIGRVCLAVIGIVGSTANADDTLDANAVPSGPPALCIAQPRIAITGRGEAVTGFSEQLRAQIAASLAGPLLTPVLLQARATRQIAAEAVQAKCRSILIIRFQHNPVSSRGKHTADQALATGEVAAGFVGNALVGNVVGLASSGSAIFGGDSSSSSGQGLYPLGKNDTVSIEFELEAVGTDGIKEDSKTLAGKAEHDNEPVVENLLEKLADDVLSHWPAPSK
jgi:hypothetical protein